MCKLLMIPNIPEGMGATAWKFTIAGAETMTKTDSHGFGVMAYSRENKIFTEKWLDVKNAFVQRENEKHDPINYGILTPFITPPTYPKTYQSTGKNGEPLTICAHARQATCEKNIENTHPFHDEENNIALIHNGVINNEKEFELRLSTCDSEAIMTAYIARNVQDRPEEIKTVAEDLEGYYACAILAETAQGYVLDIFRNSPADLVCAFVNTLGPVLATKEEIIMNACKATEMTHSPFAPFQAGVMVRIHCETGNVLGSYPFRAERNYTRQPCGSWYNRAETPAITSKQKKQKDKKFCYTCQKMRVFQEDVCTICWFPDGFHGYNNDTPTPPKLEVGI